MNPIPPEGGAGRQPDLPAPLSPPSPRLPAHRAGSTAPASLSAGPDAQNLLHAFARRWPLALIGGLAIGLGATVAAFFLVPPPKYTVKALIHVASAPARIIFTTSESVPDYRSYQKTQATLAKSRKVLTAALRQPEVAGLPAIPAEGDPASWLDRELKVDFPGGAEIMTITMTGPTPGPRRSWSMPSATPTSGRSSRRRGGTGSPAMTASRPSSTSSRTSSGRSGRRTGSRSRTSA